MNLQKIIGTAEKSFLAAAAVAVMAAWASPASAACSNRGDLDKRFCDANGDLVADTPTDASKLLNPSTLVFSYTPVEDPAV
ncbi:MAG TPA: phosphate/phosphite/phosphonate ABC transporter substrate-binding protein, partial [Rhodospirillales bacterium]|nr:phosphate/phosphite/phosphonate ABC transporter substrate-binding protein [Rhodospirillales bacterium]